MGRALLRDEVPVGPCKVRALFSWSGETPQDLGFVEGDIIEVLNTGDGDWWTGKLKRNKLVGIFPRNFAEYVNENQETMSAALTEKKRRKKLANYDSEPGEAIDFSSFSLAELQIPDPGAALVSASPSTTAAPTTSVADIKMHTSATPSPLYDTASRPSAKTALASAAQPSRHVPIPAQHHQQHQHHANSSSASSLRASQGSHTSHSSKRRSALLSASGSSQRSTKSAQEILEDVTRELNGGFLDDISFDAKPEELRTPELCGDGFESLAASVFPDVSPSGPYVGARSSGALSSGAPNDSSAAPPAPPPHRVSVSSRRSGHSRSTSMVPEDPVDLLSSAASRNAAAAAADAHISAGLGPTLGVGNGIVDASMGSHIPDVYHGATTASSFAASSKPAASQSPPTKSEEPKSSALTGPVIKPKSKSTGSQLEDDAHAPASPGPKGVDLRDATNLSELESVAIERSPNLDEEIPFNPKALKPENSIGNHIGSHIDASAYSSNLNIADLDTTRDSVQVEKVRAAWPNGSASAAATTANSNVYRPITGGGGGGGGGAGASTKLAASRDADSTKRGSFFQKLFPKNSQTFLRRSFSRSSRKSAKSQKSVTQRLRGVKSLFSFAFPSSDDESLYPTNAFSSARNSVATVSVGNPISNVSAPKPTAAAAAAAQRISTPPRAHLVGLGLVSPTGGGASSGLRNDNDNALGGRSETGAASLGVSSKEPLAGKWMESRRNLYRAKSLTAHDMQKRRKELELQGINSDNIVESLNLQNGADFHDYRLEDFDAVDQAVRTMSTWPQLMTPSVFASSRIGRHFEDPVERVRAVFLLCATRIQHVAQSPPGNNVMQSRKATALELANTVVSMCSSLDIECVTIEGQRRCVVAGAITSTPHWWNGVNVNGEWRLLDAVAAAAPSSSHGMASGGAAANAAADMSLIGMDEDADEDEVNLFYFLTPPSQLIYSHVPHDHHRQFCDPFLPTASAALLPLAAPAAFAHQIYFDEYWLGMTRLSELEVAELTLRVPDASEDLVALINGQKPALAQAYWDESENTRHFRVKAFVPPQLKQATLQIFVVPKSQASRSAEAMELLWTVELRYASGGKYNPPFDFVGRYAVPSAAEYDLYVVEPQCRQLGGGDTYTFKIESFSAQGASSYRHGPRQPKIAVQSPSGRLTRLVPFGTDVHDTFRATVKTLEVGTWRSVVRADEDQSWVPFAEWFCS